LHQCHGRTMLATARWRASDVQDDHRAMCMVNARLDVSSGTRCDHRRGSARLQRNISAPGPRRANPWGSVAPAPGQWRVYE
jgi:hypothetical protein